MTSFTKYNFKQIVLVSTVKLAPRHTAGAAPVKVNSMILTILPVKYAHVQNANPQ